MRKQLSGGVFDVTILENRSGFISMLIEGKNAMKVFGNEAGGHRFQRIPPTEKRGRVQTSTVTVAVLEENKFNFELDLNDVRYIMTRGTGPGGMHKNKTDSCVVATHEPTGLSVRIDARDQHKNKALATRILAERVSEHYYLQQTKERSLKRKAQVGGGMRGDKRRTYRVRDDKVVDHITGKSWKFSKWIKGNW